jgi:hypothetical protein
MPLDADISSRRPGSSPPCEIRGGRSGKEQAYLPSNFLRFNLLTIILAVHPSPHTEICDSPDQVACYHILGLHL